MRNNFFKILTTIFLLPLIIGYCSQANASEINNNQPIIIPPYNAAAFDQDIANFYASVPASHSAELNQRIDAASGHFLGEPYLEGALGEGAQAQFDQRPLYRTDAFDCVTYVATVLALVESNDLEQFKRTIVAINYQQLPVIFRQRNHFMEIDWNPKNRRNGYLQDITRTIVDQEGKAIALPATALIDKAAFFQHLPASSLHLLTPVSIDDGQKLLAELHRQGRFFQPEKSVDWYLPLSRLFDKNGAPDEKLFAQIPTATVIEIIRPNLDLTASTGTHMNITHLGLAIRKGNQLLFREASLIKGHVVDIPLSDYLRGYRNSPTIKGISVQKIQLKLP
jgi:hypothetical protein